MQSELVVAEAVSQHNCYHCQGLIEGLLSLHICPVCGKPQPIFASENYFTAFKIPVNFNINYLELEERFYQICRALHPDRFTDLDPKIIELSSKRMSFLNQAYETLKNPSRLREYLLTLKSESKPTATALPGELAESWFEIQDLLEEDIQGAKEKVTYFERDLCKLKNRIDEELTFLEREYNLEGSSQILAKIAEKAQLQSYLKSLGRDVERIRKYACSN